MRMKVRITMEADVTNLPTYNEPISGQENVYSIISDIYCSALSKLMQARVDTKDKSTALDKALIKSYEAERNLTKQLVKNLKIEYVP